MSLLGRRRGSHDIAFEAFGVPVLVTVPGRDREAVRALLPPGWRPVKRSAAEKHFALVPTDDGRYGLRRGDKAVARSLTRRMALAMLDSQIRSYIALHAPGWIFVHAGVVASGGKAIVVPGLTFTGKTTLVAALVRAGAVYYSDEYAVLDEDGLVHPYGKPLSLRDEQLWQVDHHVADLGGMQGDEPLPVGLIVATSFRADAEWRPERRSAGEGAMALMANTIPARERPHEVMRALTRAAEGAVFLKGDRGEADEVAPLLLELIDSTASEKQPPLQR